MARIPNAFHIVGRVNVARPLQFRNAFENLPVTADLMQLARKRPMLPGQVGNIVEAAGTRFFAVWFRRRTTKWGTDANGRRVLLAQTGDIRYMRCRLHVKCHCRNILPPGQRAAEDAMHQLKTAWDIERFAHLRSEGFTKREAGYKSYRRFPLDGVLEIYPDYAAERPARRRQRQRVA